MNDTEFLLAKYTFDTEEEALAAIAVGMSFKRGDRIVIERASGTTIKAVFDDYLNPPLMSAICWDTVQKLPARLIAPVTAGHPDPDARK